MSDVASIVADVRRVIAALADPAAQKATVGLNQGAVKGKTGTKAAPVLDSRPTLAAAGIDKKLSSRAQKLAAVPQEKFDAHLARAAAVRMAEALAAWLRGADFELALGLSPGWRQSLRRSARDAALAALLAAHPELDDNALARRIAVGVARAARTHGARPDGEPGYFRDLARAGPQLTKRQWGRHITEMRSHCNVQMSTDAALHSAPTQERDR